MDWLRSCYRAPCIFREGDSELPIQWYFCEPDAKPFPDFHAFPSANWLGNGWGLAELGEQPGTRPWKNGATFPSCGPGNANGVDCVSHHIDWWQNGLGPGDETGPFLPNGYPVCCEDGPCTCLADRYNFLPATITITSGSCSGLQLSVLLQRTDVDQCTWEGTGTSAGGDFSLRITYNGFDTWNLDAWTCSDESALVGVGPAGPCPVGTVTWSDVSSNGLCCPMDSATFDVSVTVG